MSKTKGKHLTKENREVIEVGIRDVESCRKIAKRIDVSASTVTREVRVNRTIREKKSSRGTNLSIRCVHCKDCDIIGLACEECSTKLTACKACRTRSCIDTCANFERKMCPTTQMWPYVCPEKCPKKAHCGYPKCSYDARDADEAYRIRLRSSRESIDCSPEEMAAMDRIVSPLVKQGQSFKVIWVTHASELPVCSRTAYNYQHDGRFSITTLDLPRSVRYKPRNKKSTPGRDRVDRTGRTFDDFKALPLEDQVRVVQGDSVEGFSTNENDILSLHVVARAFQIYLLKKHASPKATVIWFDVVEQACGSRALFEAIFGILLLDRGVEFDDWEGMERSCLEPGERRCRVFYCDAMKSNQKSEAERNHEQLRRILPKGRSDFDKLSAYDVATCCCHVNSYPSANRGGQSPFELLGGLLPQSLFDELGLARLDPDSVILKPYLMEHAVEQ